MTEKYSTELAGPHRIVAGIDRGISELTVFATFVVIYLWVFTLAHAVLGSQHWGWLIVGPVLVGPLLGVGIALFEARQEFLSLPWVKTALRIIASIRNILSAGALLGLARYLNGLTEQAEPTTVAQVLHGLVRVVTGS
jgi:hypothetical protein